jgi:hypothetical protein
VSLRGRPGSAGFGSFWNGTDGALRKPLILHIESAIETCAEIFPGDRGRQLDELFVAELYSQTRDLFIRRGRRRTGQRRGVVENFPFEFIEGIAGAVVRDAA